MVSVQHFIAPASFSSLSVDATTASSSTISVISYNVLLPNSVDGWWSYKMYPPGREEWSNWEYRRNLLKERIGTANADVVCLQEVAPVSFEEDFAFMSEELGYDGVELFKRGRFRPATFWRTSRHVLAAPPVHKDRTLLTAFRPVANSDTNNGGGNASTTATTKEQNSEEKQGKQKKHPRSSTAEDDDGTGGGIKTWYVLNCHLQAGKEGRRRVRQINEGVRAVMTLARKLKGNN